MFDNKKQKNHNQAIRGIATLPTILLLSGILMELAIAGTVLATVLNNTISNRRFGTEALAAARAGAQDAIIRVSRDNSFGAPPPVNYSLDVVAGRSSAQVTVCKDWVTVTNLCDTNINGRDEIISVGTVMNRKKKIVAILGVDADTGRVKIQSFEEIPL